MTETQFDEVVSGVYRAATGAATWNSALDAVAMMFRSRLTAMQDDAAASGTAAEPNA